MSLEHSEIAAVECDLNFCNSVWFGPRPDQQEVAKYKQKSSLT